MCKAKRFAFSLVAAVCILVLAPRVAPAQGEPPPEGYWCGGDENYPRLSWGNPSCFAQTVSDVNLCKSSEDLAPESSDTCRDQCMHCCACESNLSETQRRLLEATCRCLGEVASTPLGGSSTPDSPSAGGAIVNLADSVLEVAEAIEACTGSNFGLDEIKSVVASFPGQLYTMMTDQAQLLFGDWRDRVGGPSGAEPVGGVFVGGGGLFNGGGATGSWSGGDGSAGDATVDEGADWSQRTAEEAGVLFIDYVEGICEALIDGQESALRDSCMDSCARGFPRRIEEETPALDLITPNNLNNPIDQLLELGAERFHRDTRPPRGVVSYDEVYGDVVPGSPHGTSSPDAGGTPVPDIPPPDEED